MIESPGVPDQTSEGIENGTTTSYSGKNRDSNFGIVHRKTKLGGTAWDLIPSAHEVAANDG
jgi:hypothetical protein